MIRVRLGDLLDEDISAFVCPITNGLFEDPVVADDGRTYSRQAIVDWFEGCKSRQVSITSPFTREKISERLVDNFDMKRAIEEFAEKRVKAAADARAAAEQERSQRARVPPASGSAGPSAPPSAKYLSELGDIFSLLDGLRGLLAETLDGWQPPQLVVVGQESSGKSSVLERLMMTPLLPRDDDICTRLPIHVRLRRSDKAMPPKLEVYNVSAKATERGPYTIAAQSGVADVSEEMRRIIVEEQGGLRGVCAHRIIILHITNPNVPCLDLVDMPGIVTAPSGDDPADMASQTTSLIKAHLQSKSSSHSLYLAVVKATAAPNTSVSMQLLHEANLYSKTFGVFTFCDELGKKTSRKLNQWIRSPSEGQGAVALEPYGWVATANAPPEDEDGNLLEFESNFERLQRQALSEIEIFHEIGLRELLDEGLASHSALVSRLNDMFKDYLNTTWVPNTLRMLAKEDRKLQIENAMLGMPPMHQADAAPEAKEALFQAVEQDIALGLPSLLREYGRSVLEPMKGKIRSAVDKAILDVMSKARHPNLDSVIVSGYQRDLLSTLWGLGPNAAPDLTLLYRASHDGWNSSDFHAKCDNKGETLTLVKCTDGYVFGGYASASVSWKSGSAKSGSSYSSQSAPGSFLFSLHGPSREGPVKLHLKDPNDGYAMRCHTSHGPTFGGIDFHLSSNANNCTSSYTSLGKSYHLPDGQSPETFFTGQRNFQAAEVEVFSVVHAVPYKGEQGTGVVHLNPSGGLVVPLEQFDRLFDKATDVYTPLVDLCNRTLQDETFSFVEEIRGLFPKAKRGDAVIISGAIHHTACNGIFIPDEVETSGGKPVYKSKDKQTRIQFLETCNKWAVQRDADKGTENALLCSVSSCPQAETVAQVEGGWCEYDSDSATFVNQASVTVSYKVPEWPSEEADNLVKNPQLRLADRFPELIDAIVEEVSRDLKPAADAKVLEAVTRLAQELSEEVRPVDLWRKELTLDGVVVYAIKSDRLSTLAEKIVLSFLRYHTAMLRDMLTRVRDIVHRSSLVESCATKRLELVSRKQELDRAQEGLFNHVGAHSEAEKHMFLSTGILSVAQTNSIVAWLEEGRSVEERENVGVTLLYRASRDGWNSSDFHAKCDNKGETLTLVKCTDGYVFGGYASVSWKSGSGSSQSAPGSFLFSLHGPSREGPVKLHLKDPNDGCAMRCHSSFGPTFGEASDFHLSSNANNCTGSGTRLGKTYHLPDGQSPDTFFTGQFNFQAAEVEVFSVDVVARASEGERSGS